MPATPLYERKAELFRTLAHPWRIRLLELLVDGETTVGQLGAQVDMEASHLSQQLAVLRRTGLVVSRRVGSHVFYRLASKRVAGLLDAARVLLTEVLAADVTLLDELEHSP